MITFIQFYEIHAKRRILYLLMSHKFYMGNNRSHTDSIPFIFDDVIFRKEVYPALCNITFYIIL